MGHEAGAYPGFRSMKRLRLFLLPPGWDASPSRVIPSIKFAGTHLYTWVERGNVGVKCLTQEHNTMSPARARTQTARSGVERTNHEATAPPTITHIALQKTTAHSNGGRGRVGRNENVTGFKAIFYYAF